METKIAAVTIPEPVLAGGNHLPAGEYRVEMPESYDPARIDGEDLLLDPALRIVDEGTTTPSMEVKAWIRDGDYGHPGFWEAGTLERSRANPAGWVLWTDRGGSCVFPLGRKGFGREVEVYADTPDGGRAVVLQLNGDEVLINELPPELGGPSCPAAPPSDITKES